MEILEKIFDLPTLAQGILGSFAFWVLYQLAQRGFNFLSSIIGKFNNNIRKENILYEQAHILQSLIPIQEVASVNAHIISIQSAIFKSIQGCIFISFGLITSSLLKEISIIAYVIAVYYFFRALKAGYVKTFSDGETDADREKRLSQLREEYEKLGGGD